MSKEELEKVIRELYRLWNNGNLLKDAYEDIDFILSQVIKEIGK